MPTTLPVMLPILPLDASRTIPEEERSAWADQFIRELRATLGLPSGGWDAQLVGALTQVQRQNGLPDQQEQVIQAVIGVPVVACATYRALGLKPVAITYASPLLKADEQTNIVLAVQYGLLDLRCQKSWLDMVWQYVPYVSLIYLGLGITRSLFGWLAGERE